MSVSSTDVDRLLYLVDAVCSKTASDDELAELDAILLADETSHSHYLDYCRLHVALGLESQMQSAVEKAFEKAFELIDFGPAEATPVDSAIRIAVSSPSSSVSPSVLGFLGDPIGYIPQGAPFAYLVATVLVGLGLAIASLIPASRPEQLADNSSPSASPTIQPEIESVGRITGMVDCRWAESSMQASGGARVRLGRKYALAAGLMEITYDTGAKVILQGPVTYEVESKAGGFLSLGKLTARLEKNDKRGTLNAERSASSSSFIVHRSSFAVRTPAATVTDLGTEFAVEVDKGDATDVQVFVGKVEVAPFVERGVKQQPQTIHAGQCVRVRTDSAIAISTDKRNFEEHAQRFTRTMPGNVNVGDAYAETVLSMAPAVYYRMDKWPTTDKNGRYVLVDSAPGAHHGVVCVDEAFGMPNCRGKFNGALEVHGSTANEYAFVSNYPKAENGKLSASAWVRPVALNSWAVIVANWCHPLSHETAEEGIGRFAFGVNHALELMVQIRCQDGKVADVCERGIPLFRSQWHHVAFVADGAVLHLYRNGVEVGAVPCRSIVRQSAPECLSVGCTMNRNGTGPRSESAFLWDGWIDEIAIFNHALSAEQVHQLYTGHATAKSGRTGQ